MHLYSIVFFTFTVKCNLFFLSNFIMLLNQIERYKSTFFRLRCRLLQIVFCFIASCVCLHAAVASRYLPAVSACAFFCENDAELLLWFCSYRSRRCVPIDGDKCFYWRTTGCFYGDKCRFKHIPDQQGRDKKP